MDSRHATFLGRRHLPREVTAFEIEVFFQFSAGEARINEGRRRPELKRMSGRLLDAGADGAAAAVAPGPRPMVGTRCVADFVPASANSTDTSIRIRFSLGRRKLTPKSAPTAPV
jgi:hypothetical protein